MEKTIDITEKKEISSPQSDKYIWGIFILLCLVSLIESYSASSREVSSSGIYMPIIKQALMLGSGAFIAYIIQRFPYQTYIKFIPLFAALTIGLLIYVEIAGEVINGAKRAISVLGISIQPAEMAKLGVVLLIAWILSKNQMEEGVTNKGVVLSSICVMIFGALLVKQGLTNTILMMGISLSMMLIGGIQWRKLFTVIVVYGIFGIAMFIFISSSEPSNPAEQKEQKEALIANGVNPNQKLGRWDTWMARIKTFKDPVPLYDKPLTSKNQQEMMARMAQANGGVFGVLPGNSRECSRLPLAFSDYIYSIILEELGLVGGCIVLVLYLSLFARAGSIVSKCKKALPALMVMGVAVTIVFQALFHMAINTGVFPVSGQPLPLISKGGTSILMTSIAFGLMLSVSKYAAQNNKKKDIKAESNKLPEDFQGANVAQL